MSYEQLAILVATFICVVAAAVTVLFPRRNPDHELQADVEELAILVERLSKNVRREKMARVRAGSADVAVQQAPQADIFGTPAPSDPRAVKTALRARLRGTAS